MAESEALEPRGRKTERIEAVAELEIGQAIEAVAEMLSATPPGGTVPVGYRAEAIRALLVRGADSMGVSAVANRRAAEIRTREHRE